MNIITQEITWGGNDLVMTNQRVLYWPKYAALILSDIHLGKAAYFRKNGIPITGEVHYKDLTILRSLIDHCQAKKVIVVGDLVHGYNNHEVSDFRLLTEDLAQVEFVLIKGNHDRVTDDRLKELGIHAVYTKFTLDNITFVHEPMESFSGYQLSGHIHPGISLHLSTRKHVRLPAFVVTKNNLILPAFSQFTGLDTQTIFEEATHYAFSESGFVKI